jgi:hypothetical protein
MRASFRLLADTGIFLLFLLFTPSSLGTEIYKRIRRALAPSSTTSYAEEASVSSTVGGWAAVGAAVVQKLSVIVHSGAGGGRGGRWGFQPVSMPVAGWAGALLL